MRGPVSVVAELNLTQTLERDRPGLRCSLSLVERSESHIFEYCVAEELVVRILKYQSDPPAYLAGRLLAHGHAFDPNARSSRQAAIEATIAGADSVRVPQPAAYFARQQAIQVQEQ